MLALPDPPILVITDRGQCPEPLEARAKKLFRGGCRWLSLREKDMGAGERRALLRRLMDIGADFGARVGVHGDVEAALDLGAPVHLPAGADLVSVRLLAGSKVFLGQSCHDAAEVDAAAGADYVTLSPVFISASKPGYAPVFSLIDLAAIAGRSSTPIVALGGVTAANVALLARSGVRGIAVMGGAMSTPEPENWFGDVAARWAIEWCARPQPDP